MNKSKYKTIFFGTPGFSIPFLDALIKDVGFDVVGVVTESDRPRGRGKKMKQSPVAESIKKCNNEILKQVQNNRKIKIFKPKEIASWKLKIGNLRPDLAVVVAYGQIIPKEILDIPKHGVVNVHPSDLPKHRGSSPIQAALLFGDNKTAVTIMKIDELMDHGTILDKLSLNIDADDDYFSLEQKILVNGPKFLIKTLNKYLEGEIRPTPQNHKCATYCKLIKKNDGEINWSKRPEQIHNKIRAYVAWPKAYTLVNGKRLIFLKSELVSGKIKPLMVQLEGKKPTSWKEFVNGYKEKLPKELTDRVI